MNGSVVMLIEDDQHRSRLTVNVPSADGTVQIAVHVTVHVTTVQDLT